MFCFVFLAHDCPVFYCKQDMPCSVFWCNWCFCVFVVVCTAQELGVPHTVVLPQKTST